MKKSLLLIVLILLTSTGCAQPVAMNEETPQMTSFTVQDVDACEDIVEYFYTTMPKNVDGTLRDLVAIQWVLVDDETLRIALRDLHMMNFDMYQTLLGKDDVVGVTAGRSEYQISTEYMSKMISIVSRCQKIRDEDK